MYVVDEIYEVISQAIRKHEKAKNIAISSKNKSEQTREEGAIEALKGLYPMFHSEEEEE